MIYLWLTNEISLIFINMDIRKIIKEEMDNFDWIENIEDADIYDVCNLENIGRDLVGHRIEIVKSGGKYTKGGYPVGPTILRQITQPWSDDVKIWVNYRGELKSYGCG